MDTNVWVRYGASNVAEDCGVISGKSIPPRCTSSFAFPASFTCECRQYVIKI